MRTGEVRVLEEEEEGGEEVAEDDWRLVSKARAGTGGACLEGDVWYSREMRSTSSLLASLKSRRVSLKLLLRRTPATSGESPFPGGEIFLSDTPSGPPAPPPSWSPPSKDVLADEGSMSFP